MENEFYMAKAIEAAKVAFEKNEVPIGAVIVYKDEIIGTGFNERIGMKNALYHGEITAINKACNWMKDWRLEDCVIYVTIEPCPMCAGAILQARIKKVVFGAKNQKAGCCGSVVNLLQMDGFNHKVEIESGVMEEDCAKLVKDFFKKFRK